VLEVLNRGDGRRSRQLVEDWNRWIIHLDSLYRKFIRVVGESPFSYNELAATGFLASAAANAGFLPLTEYAVVKRSKLDRRAKVDGRADLWFSTADRWYSFEVKLAWHIATRANLAASLKAASEDVACLPTDEYHFAAGVLIAWVKHAEREQIYRSFADDSNVHFAYRIGPGREDGAFLFFTLL